MIERQRIVRPPARLTTGLSHPPLVLAEQHPAQLLEPGRRIVERPDDRLPLGEVETEHLHLAPVGGLEQLTWGDVDEQRGRWRVSRAVAKTRHGRWVNVPPSVFAAVTALCPRDDRSPARRVFQGVTADRLRTAIGRACVAAGVPVFSPHDLRHRRISLMHLAGVPWARIGEQVGQRDLAVTANTYTHVRVDEAELDYERMVK